MAGPSARKRPLLDRRGFLLGMAWIAPGLPLLTLPRALFAKGREIHGEMRIKNHCPGGEVEVLLDTPGRGARCTLEVRRASEPPTTVACARMEGLRCSLILDLPDCRWQPGLYSARICLVSVEGAALWESRWKPAFTLRPMPWDG